MGPVARGGRWRESGQVARHRVGARDQWKRPFEFPILSISGTHWKGPTIWSDGDRYDFTAEFRSDGVLVYSYKGKTWSDGFWRQNGAKIVFSLNNAYATYEGTLSGDVLSGTMKNKQGSTGTWRWVRS
jgi:hypothetical protein